MGKSKSILLSRRGGDTLILLTCPRRAAATYGQLSDEQLRALLFLARNPNGCSEALLMVHGFPTQMLEVVTTGLAKASPEKMKIARMRRKVVCFQITDAGRKAAANN